MIFDQFMNYHSFNSLPDIIRVCIKNQNLILYSNVDFQKEIINKLTKNIVYFVIMFINNDQKHDILL